MERFNFKAIEQKWQRIILKQKLYNKKGSKFYCLEMFPTHLEKFIWGM